jgi:hypothetical protein
VTAKLALVSVLLVGMAACHRCEDTVRDFVVDAPDPDLNPLLQTCLDAKLCITAGGYYCTPPECLPACRRVAQLANDTAAESSMKTCRVVRGPDGGTSVQVTIGFESCS